jgi:hypothetical protein
VPELLGWVRATPAALAAEAAKLLWRHSADDEGDEGCSGRGGGSGRGVWGGGGGGGGGGCREELGDDGGGGGALPPPPPRARSHMSAREEFIAALTPDLPGTVPSVAAARAILDAVQRRQHQDNQ